MRFPRFSLFHPSLFFLYNRVESYNLHYQSFSFSLFNCRIIKRLAFLRVKDALQVFKHSAGFLLQGFIYIYIAKERSEDRCEFDYATRTTSSFLSNRSIKLIESFSPRRQSESYPLLVFQLSKHFSFSLATSIHYLLLPSFFFHSFYKKIK